MTRTHQITTCSVQYMDERPPVVPLANIKLELQRWPEKLLISGKSETKCVTMVTNCQSHICEAHLVESYRKESYISDTNWLRHI